MTYEEAQNRYEELLRRYTAAMVSRTGDVQRIFDDAARAWIELSNLAPAGAAEAGAPADGHLGLAFSHAVAACDRQEARRVYDLLGDEDRGVIDRHDARVPGEMKIWLTPD